MYRRGLALCALTATMLLSLGGTAGGGGGEEFAFSYSPQSGPPGTVITVSGTDCVGPEADTRVQVVLSTQGGTVIATGFSPLIVFGGGGNWTVMITVPLGTPPGTYDLQAFCGEAGVGVFPASVPNPAGTLPFVTYTPGQFVVPTSPPPATAAPAPAPTAEPAPVPVAPPAATVAAAPQFTG